MKTTRQALGRWGESLAADYLVERGYTILERNARTPYGEIDLVAHLDCDQGAANQSDPTAPQFVVVFVEVKTRSSTAFGLPEAAVSARKQAHILAAAQAYLQAHPDLGDDWRVDVIAIQRSKTGDQPVITHFENAVS